MRMTMTSIMVLMGLCATTLAVADQTVKPLVLEVRADQPGHPINKTQYGVFFEELNHAGEGGLYAELVNNRSFEDSLNSIPEWTFYTTGAATGAMSLETADHITTTTALVFTNTCNLPKT